MVQPGQTFCASCGRAIAGVPGRPASRGRVAEHVSIVGALWLVVGALNLMGGGFLIALSSMPFTRFMSPEQVQSVPFEQARSLSMYVQTVFLGFGLLFVLGAAASFLSGWGLLKRKSWARMLALVLAFLGLLSFPFGTALGVYTIWVLLAGNGEHEYRRLVASA